MRAKGRHAAVRTKAVLSGLLVAAISTIARRYPGWGGLIASLPLVSVLSMLWLYGETRDAEAVAKLSIGAFWFFLPSIPMFLAHPGAAARRGRFRGDDGDRLRDDDGPLRRNELARAARGDRAVSQRDAVVLLSGGLDSMVCAALAREAGLRRARADDRL